MTILRPQASGIPLPAITELSRPYWDGCARGRLLYQSCGSCGAALSDPGYICRWCHARDLHWQESSGSGTVYSWSTVWRPQTAAFRTPYVVSIIELDEGFYLMSNVVGCQRDEIHLGMPVQVVFHEVDGFTLPYFAPPTV